MRLKAQLSAMHIQQKSLSDKKNVDNDINISNENFINALNKQIARLKSENNNLEIQNKKLNEEKINNLQSIRNLEQEVINMQSTQEINQLDDNINMNSQMNNMIQQYKKQINDLTSQLNILHNENMSLQQNQRSLMSSNMDSRGHPRSEVNDTYLQPNQLWLFKKNN